MTGAVFLPADPGDSAGGEVTGEFPVVNFGADPTGANDSTLAIQAAQTAAEEAGGGYVVFGSGIFKFGTITVAGVAGGSAYITPPLVHFRFSGPGATVLTPNAANIPLFQVQSAKFAAGVRFEGGFTIKAHASGLTGPAIDLTNARQWVIESPSYLDSSGGLSPTPGTYAQVIGFGINTYACRIVNPVCEGQTLGACFAGSINKTTVIANSNSIENPLFEENTSPYMIDAAGTLQLTISDGIIEGNTTTAAIRLGWMTTVRNSYFEQGNAAGVSFAMDGPGVDNPGLGYDPGQCWLENNIHASNPDTLTIPAGVHPFTTLIFTPAFGSAFQIVDNTNTLSQFGSGTIKLPAGPVPNYGGIFGDGSDGAATLDGTATVAWASKSGLTYTLTRDAWLTSLTISSGATLLVGTSGNNSYRIFCSGTVTNNGTISANGIAASGTTAGAALGVGSLAGSGAGGASTVTNGGAGGAATSSPLGMGMTAAGAGGAGSGGTAGAGGNTGSTSANQLRSPQALAVGLISLFGTTKNLGGGPGGGAGGGDAANKGGGGGSGGGLIGILAHAVVNAGTITAAGGAGGTPPTGNCGGGGGGSAGLILVFTLAPWTAGTTVVTGGAPGTGVGTGAAGIAGGAGTVLNVVVT